MKEWLIKNKEFFKSKLFIISLILLIVFMVIAITLGFGYVIIIFVFAGLYFLSKQSSSERIISPKFKDETNHKILEMEDEANFIRQHIQENPQDLEAKLMLRELEKEIKKLKDEANL